MRLLQIGLLVVVGAGGLVLEAESDAGAATISAHERSAARQAKRKHRKHHKHHKRHRTPPPAQEM